ncbi:MAG: dihydrolipoyl dehydrogenase [Armatimonadota bacterium]
MQGVALLRSAEIAHRYEFRTVTLPGESVELSLGHALGIPSLEDLDSSPARVRPDIKEEPLTAPDYGTDIVIIGAGPAGYVAAIRAAQLGGRVVVVEKSQVGGVCLNIGCIPTKVLLACVATLDQIKRGEEFGIKVRGFDLDIPTMMARKERIVKQLTSGVEALFRKNKVRLVRGLARIVDPHTISVQTDGGTEQIRTRAILIATGSIPAPLPVPGLELGGNVWTSTEALSFDRVPAKMLVIGAGAIGLEAGYTFARLGTDVLVVEMMSQILPAADGETARFLQKSLEKSGMRFMLDAVATRAEDTKAGKKVWIKSGDSEVSEEFDTVLVAVGRRAVIDGIGLDEVGVRHDKRKILVNEHMQTNIPSIYAAGDCIGEPMLAHVAWTESVVAVEHAMGMDSRMHYKAYPACVYTTPECASVGLTEEKAREQHRDVRTGKFSFSHNGKALAIGEAEGFIKFVTEPRYGQILGVHMVGPHVTDLIAEAVLAMRNELTIDEVIATIHPHPTVSEVVQEAAMDAQGRAVHK